MKLFKYGRPAVVTALVALFNLAFRTAKVPAIWREGEIVCLHKKGDKSEVNNYRPITLMCALGKLYTRVLNNRLMRHLERLGLLHECQAAFRHARDCMNHTFSGSQVIQGRLRQHLITYGLFIDGEKAYDRVWRDGLFYKAWKMGIRGRMWIALRGIMAQTSSRVKVGSSLSEPFTRNQGIDQGCILSTTLFAIFINDLPTDVATALHDSTPVHGTVRQGLFADDYFGLANGRRECQLMADAASAHARRWRWRANLGKDKTAIVVFRRPGRQQAADEGAPVMWGDTPIPVQDSYRHLGILLSSTGTWDDHLADVLNRATSRVNQLARVLTNRYLDVPVKLLIVKACLLPVLEYGSAVWHADKKQADLLGCQYLRALKMVLQCPITTPTAAVMHELGMPTLQHRWDLSKLRLQQKLQHMPLGRDPKAVFETSWGGRGAHMWADKLANIWKQLIPDRDARVLEQTRLANLDAKHFDTEACKLVADREALNRERGMRCKSKLTLYAAVCGLEHQGHLQGGAQSELKQ